METLKSKKITQKEQKLALDSVSVIEGASRKVKDVVLIKFDNKAGYIKIPKKALMFFLYIIKNMAEGKAINLVSLDSEITTEEAAVILNVSRPHVVKLLESGEIPFKKVGTHRRIQFDDVLTYNKKMAKIRQEQLATLSRLDQDLNLYNE